MKINGISSGPVSVGETAAGTIETLAPVVVEGNSRYYVVLSGRDGIYDVPVSEFPQIVRFQEGDAVTFEYIAGEELHTVTGIR